MYPCRVATYLDCIELKVNQCIEVLVFDRNKGECRCGPCLSSEGSYTHVSSLSSLLIPPARNNCGLLLI